MALAHCGARALPLQLSSLARSSKCSAARRLLSACCQPLSSEWPSLVPGRSNVALLSSIGGSTRGFAHGFGSTHPSLQKERGLGFGLRASTTEEVLTEVAEEAAAEVSKPNGESYKGREKIKDIRGEDEGLSKVGQQLVIRGWVRTVRAQKAFAFMQVNDGSNLSGLQVVIHPEAAGYDKIQDGTVATGAAVAVEGELVESLGGKQKVELKATKLTVVGESDGSTYPLQKKNHTLEYLRTIAHLRPRTNTIGAVSRVRSALAFATHQFFQSKGFTWVATPIITAADCEGAGEQFLVTTLVPQNGNAAGVPTTKEGKVDFSQDFFGKPAYLTVSGQLNAEVFATALSDVYTFGPTFRAENSNTSRHLAEFWMLEPELAFADLKDDMACAEAYLQHVVRYVLEHCREDLAFFVERQKKGLPKGEKNVVERLTDVANARFAHVTYTEAVDILLKAKKSFEFPVKWGADLQSEHERYLTEVVFKGQPVIVTDYPKEIKAFYMRENDDGKTVAAMDVLVPGVGELIGGSQREERLEVLEKKLEDFKLEKEAFWWYLDLRKYGSVPHAGFGLGFERLVQYVTGVENIRDVIAFPRAPGLVDF
ncbi:Aspartyl/Asparaginyl-tRNA synthetase class IIb [Klebsormidium nitens]|uniref:asparagine--tRNA ligase n=1 Tax=Klebsormidium nitens TaxID=105231 RepID=A0A1Y1I8F8_KLENI|nr:Aspartyl/Asparaginyl-tRNA synthetase class IIb [Klebsormidium nitens]|eukprot:GAQ84976.1 Aspartyl/Asparaginyl-tRNA synthetase class IIb [Klebsormidium nitens]